MRRREFLIAAGGAALLPRFAFAQTADRPRIAVVSLPMPSRYLKAVNDGLADYGYVDGTNISVAFHTAATWGDLPAAALAAVTSGPAIVVTNGTSATLAASAAAGTIPLVFASLTDPVGIGLIASRGRPGGTITGSTLLTPDLIGRQLTIVKQILPDMRRLAVLGIAGDAPSAIFADQVVDAATQLDLDPTVIHFVPARDFEAEFERVLAADAQAVYVPTSGYFVRKAALLGELQARHRLPLIGTSVDEGGNPPFIGVIAYGAAVAPVIRQSAFFIDAILKGARPGDLAVKPPMAFDFAVNVRAAKAIGLTIPPSMVAEATLVIG